MVMKYLICVLVVMSIVKTVRLDDMVSQNEINDSNYGPGLALGPGTGPTAEILYPNENLHPMQPYNQPYNNSPIGYNGGSWFDSAKKMLAAPAGQIVVHMAKEMISRSTGNSQILSLNLTNLLILVLLKALIFAAGLIGAGNWGQYARARSYDYSVIRSDEAPLFVGFLALEGSGNDGCLNLAACNAPETATEYLKAARAIIKGTEMFDKKYINSTKDYSYTLHQLEQSIQKGFDGGPCDSIYHCHL